MLFMIISISSLVTNTFGASSSSDNSDRNLEIQDTVAMDRADLDHGSADAAIPIAEDRQKSKKGKKKKKGGD